jgi:PIN domain nuclease of toxin-antitoxin system
VKLLLDTHLLIRAAEGIDCVPTGARASMADPENELFFSAPSLWEIAIRRGLGRADFRSMRVYCAAA